MTLSISADVDPGVDLHALAQQCFGLITTLTSDLKTLFFWNCVQSSSKRET